MKMKSKNADLKTRLTLDVPRNEIARLIRYAMKRQGWEIGCLKNSSYGELDAV